MWEHRTHNNLDFKRERTQHQWSIWCYNNSCHIFYTWNGAASTAVPSASRRVLLQSVDTW